MSYDLGTAHGKITLDYDGGPAAEDADDDIKRLQRSSKEADGDLKRFGKTLGKVFGVIGKAAAITGLVVGLTSAAIQAGALGVQLLGIIPPLLQIGSLVGALPALLLAGVAAVGVLAAAFVGVGDAIGAAFSGDLEKFNEALEKLSPQAREFAQGVRAIVPGLKAVQQGIQDAFFANNLQDLFPRLLGGLRSLVPQLNQVAAQFGGMTRQVLAFAGSQETIDLFRGAIGLLQRALIDLTPAIQPILNGLRDVGRVGLEFLEPMTDNVADLAIRFGQWMSSVANGGQLFGWMQGAAQTLGTLKDIAEGFGGALLGIFRIAEQTGGGLLNTLAEIGAAFNAFVNSAQGQEAIGSMFTAILEVARQLAPVFTTLAGTVLQALGPALLRLAQNVGPILLDVVQRLAPALTPVAEALADVLIAVAPLLPVLAQAAAVIATLLAGALTNLAGVLGPIIEMFASGLAGAWETLMPLATELATQLLPVMAEAGLELAKAFAPLIPSIIQLAQALVANLLPVLPQIASLLAEQLVPALVELATVLGKEGVKALEQFVALIPVLVSILSVLLPIFVTWFSYIIRTVAAVIQLLSWIRQLPGVLLGLAVALVQLIGKGLVAAWNAIVNFGTQVFGFFSALPGRIASFLSALPGMLADLFTRALNGALFAVGFGIGLIIAQITKMPVAIGRALAALPGMLLDLHRRAWDAVFNFVTSSISKIIGLVGRMAGRARSALSNLLPTLRNAGTQALNGLRTAVEQGIAKVLRLANDLPGKIKRGIGNLGSLLRSAGADLIRGLINGMESLIGRALDIARNAANKIKDGIKSALSIGSPSRIMVKFGEWTIEGLIIGMRRMFGLLGKTADAVANSVVAPTATAVYVPTSLPTTSSSTRRPQDDPDAGGTFGPYIIQVGEKTFVEMVVDAVTGVPKVIDKAAREGGRKNAWANSGRAAVA